MDQCMMSKQGTGLTMWSTFAKQQLYFELLCDECEPVTRARPEERRKQFRSQLIEAGIYKLVRDKNSANAISSYPSGSCCSTRLMFIGPAPS